MFFIKISGRFPVLFIVVPRSSFQTVFGSGSNALDVGAMTPDRKGRSYNSEGQQWLVPRSGVPVGWLGLVSVEMAQAIGEVSEHGNTEGSQNTAEAYIAGKIERSCENKE